MKLYILVGIPGSGKTTYRNESELSYVNQDEIGSRGGCLQKAKQFLKEGKDVIIDRTNINRKQRAFFIELGKKFNCEIECVEFKCKPEIAIKRILERKNHPTIKEGETIDKISEIVLKFNNDYEEPMLEEGFNRITVIYTNPKS